MIERLAQAAKDLGWSEGELATKAGLSRNQLGASRARASRVDWEIIEAMVSVLHEHGFRRDWLLFGEPPKIPPRRAGADQGPLPPPVRKKRGE